ncbi:MULTISPECIES: hypothetical protein [Desulfovibrio]|jgi:uncharacterized protein YbjQ (UPF0145 family)|uniref:hypothetical protein n=1 Tax=Desulfovibrio TaxID=872 RepID=UPI0003F528CC|nr:MULTISPECIES: hypothetical protein [Desulfovibrio]MDY0307769.1 hypothetical protein [Desulfovibrionaceae bacterium]HMM38110.1 hypothetical protein [Desulfovibrio sp.]
MALLFGAPTRKLSKTDDGQDVRLAQAREAYLAGKIKIVTTDMVPNQEVAGTFGLIVCRGFVFDNAFHGLIAQALDVNADAIVAYRESVAFHPEGDRYYSCYGTAVRLKIKK